MPQDSNPSDDNTRLPAHDMLSAIKSIEPLLGHRILDALIADLRTEGMDLERDGAAYSIAELQILLEGKFGNASTLLVDQIRKSLDRKV